MNILDYVHPNGLVPAAPVPHGYSNFWVRDGYYVGLCCGGAVKDRIWDGMIKLLDSYRWKLEIHSKKPPQHWYEYIHIRYSPTGKEIEGEHWMHNQFDAYANWGEICLDVERFDLAALLVDYLHTLQFHKKPSAGAWEDRNTCDAYSLAACIHFLQRAKKFLPLKQAMIEHMVRLGTKRLYALMPFATVNKTVCLSLLGVIWPFDMAGPYKQDIIDLAILHLKREPYGFIRYPGDSYDGEGFSRKTGTETPWLLGDCFLAKIEPHNRLWKDRLDVAHRDFKCIPEAYDPGTMNFNRNTPLLWAEAMYQSLL